MSFSPLTRLLTRVRNARRSHVVAVVILVLGAVLATPLFANQSGWTWTDRSGVLPYRDGVSIDLLSANGGSWLVSDHTRLYQVNGDTVKDLTAAARSRGLNTISTLSSDDQRWFVGGRTLDGGTPRAFITDGNEFTDVSNIFSQARGNMEAIGSRGMWYGRTFTTVGQYEPARWTAFAFNPTTLEKTTFPITSDLNNMAPGCFKEVTGVRVCIGESKIVRAGGQWFIIGGNAEVANDQNVTTQFAKGGIWNLNNGTRLTAVQNLPAFRFVSGIWQGKDQVLVATSDAVSNQFSADHYWVFDGTTLRDVSSEALTVGLLSNDAREVRAAQAGDTWLITLGKTLIRFDGEHMSSDGKTRDFFTTVTSNGQGVYLLGGAVSTADQSFATQPLTAKLVEVREDMNAPLTTPANLVSRLRGPSIKITAIPRNNVVGDGKIYTFRVTAQDADGVANTSVIVNGAKLKTCNTNVCEYTQTYYTNGQPTRSIEFMGGATDKEGYSNTSKPVTLTIDRASTVSAANDKLGETDAAGQIITIPNNKSWNRDTNSGLAWMVWRQPEQSELKDNEQTTIVFAAQRSAGLGRVNIVVNGDNARSCDFTSNTDIRVCTITLTGADYPAATEIFVNAQIFNSLNTETQSVWTEGVRVKRAANSATVTTGNGQTVQYAANPRPTFVTALTISPDNSNVRRGDSFKVQTTSQNTGNGLMNVEIYQNDKIIRICSVGTVVSPVKCEATVDTTTMQAGTSLTFSARAIDTRLNVIWSNVRVITIRDTTMQPQPLNAQGPIKVWNWMTPDISEMFNWQTTYAVGAWSPNGIERIEMIVDGQVRRTCSFGVTTGNRECDIVLKTDDYADMHSLSVNARITDGKGNKAWSDVRSVLIRRVWVDDTTGQVPAYAAITTNDNTGYNVGERITFKARGWSPYNVERIHIYLNGEKVADCPGNICEFTSAPITTNQVEYQARAIDAAGNSAWTGLIGMSKK